MPWLVNVDHDQVGIHERTTHPTHKVAQHEAALVANGFRNRGREVLGTNKDDFYIIEAADPANVITISVVKGG